MALNIISWNIAGRADAWRRLLDTDADIALVQEAREPPKDVAARVETDDEPWSTDGADAQRPWRAAVVRVSNRVRASWHKPVRIEQAGSGDFGVSRRGTLAAADIIDEDGTAYTMLSMYGLWELPHSSTGSSWIYADASVHRVISDLTVFVGRQDGHRVLAAGDLNILYGYGEEGSVYWRDRYATVFDRMKAMGMPFVGPQAPHGRCADPWPSELPVGSANVPTYYTNRMTPAQASRQLDFVFASAELIPRLIVRALNSPNDWGPSDHCRVRIELR